MGLLVIRRAAIGVHHELLNRIEVFVKGGTINIRRAANHMRIVFVIQRIAGDNGPITKNAHVTLHAVGVIRIRARIDDLGGQ